MRHGHRSALAALWSLMSAMLAMPAAAQTYTFKTVNYNTTDSTVVKSISNGNVLAADDIDSSGVNHCFTVTGTKKTLVNDTKGTSSSCVNINKSASVAGGYVVGSTAVGFIYAGGKFSDVTGPKGSTYSYAYGLNDAGTVIGSYVDAGGAQHGFILHGTKYTSFDAPGSSATLGIDINNAGDYTAQGFDSSGIQHSYLITSAGATELVFPGSISTRVHALNNKGLVAVSWQDGNGVRHGGVYNATTKAYTKVDVTGAAETNVFGINDKQSLSGFFIEPGDTREQGFRAAGHIP